ncbi:MAG: hypothetical protein ACKV2T_32970 [Kofleriaceae bacterium]
MHKGVYGLAVVIALGPSIPKLVGACTVEWRYNGYSDDNRPETPGDTTPPTLSVAYHFDRTGAGCGNSGPCDTNWSFLVLVPTPTDDRTPAEFIHYRLEVIRGTPPEPSWQDLGFVHGVDRDGEIGLTFDDDVDDFTFDLQITAVDISGNASEPFVLTIED